MSGVLPAVPARIGKIPYSKTSQSIIRKPSCYFMACTLLIAELCQSQWYGSSIALALCSSFLMCGKTRIREIPLRFDRRLNGIPNDARNLRIKQLRFLQMPESFRLSAAVPQEPLVFIWMPFSLLVKANQSLNPITSHKLLLQNIAAEQSRLWWRLIILSSPLKDRAVLLFSFSCCQFFFRWAGNSMRHAGYRRNHNDRLSNFFG